MALRNRELHATNDDDECIWLNKSDFIKELTTQL